MSPLPGQRPTTTAGQSDLFPVSRPAPVELYIEHDPIVHVPDPYDPSRSVAVRRSQLQPPMPYQPRDLAPVPLLDPIAQRMLGAGVGGGALSAGVGYGAAQIISAAAGGVTGVGVLLLLLLAARFTTPSSTTQIHNTVHNHNKWWGHSSTSL